MKISGVKMLLAAAVIGGTAALFSGVAQAQEVIIGPGGGQPEVLGMGVNDRKIPQGVLLERADMGTEIFNTPVIERRGYQEPLEIMRPDILCPEDPRCGNNNK